MTQVDFPLEALRAYLDALLGARDVLKVERASGGQSNPTYFVTHGDRRMVLRKQPPGPLLPGAHAVDREFRVQQALWPTPVPVPKPLHFSADAAVLGTPFYLMERIEGRVFDDTSLAALAAHERMEIWLAAADAMALMHAVRPAEVGLSDFGRQGNYFERQMNRWLKQWRGSTSDPIPELDRLADLLVAAMPPDDGELSIAHGDFRLGNLLFHPTKPQVVAILDWELATLGHPLADLGYCCIAWNTATDEYGGLLGIDLGERGLPSEETFVARYMKGSMRPLKLLPFHKAFALFRFAVIFVGIADRAKQGNAAGSNATELAPLARRFAIRGLNVLGRS